MRSKNLVASSSYYVRNMMNNNRISGHDILIHYRLSLSLFLEEEEEKKDFLENFACVLELLIFIEIVVVFPTRAPQYISKISNKQELQLS